MKLGFNIVNFIVPEEPFDFKIEGNNGIWEFQQHFNYNPNREALNTRVHAAVTYIADHDDLGMHKDDEILNELIHLCLSFSYLTSNAVTVKQSTDYSRISFIQVGDGFPRERGISNIKQVFNNQRDFIIATNQMIKSFDQNKIDYNIEVIIHFWLDIISCWSLEDLFLGACTILEIIKQCERKRTGNTNMHFYDAIVSVSTHLGLTVLNRDWINMRNDLIHEGHLSKVRFPNKSKLDCIKVCECMMLWIDEFIRAIFGLGIMKQKRFDNGSLVQLNSYTTWD